MSRNREPSRELPRDYRPLPERRTRSLDRDELPRLRPVDLEALRIVGSFRIVDRRDLKAGDIARLQRQGLIVHKMLEPRTGGKRQELLYLTPRGQAVLGATRDPNSRQQYWTGQVKPREVNHDIAIYRAYEKERQAIEANGGKVRRVVLDFEFKSQINARMNAREGPSKQERQCQIADEYQLPLINEKVMLPDARIEYEDPDGMEKHKDIEVITDSGSYWGRVGASKRDSGFKLYRTGSSSGSKDGGSKRIWDDHKVSFL